LRVLVVVVVEVDEIQVGRVAQLLAAQPTVGDHREAGTLAVPALHQRPDVVQRDREHPVGEFAQEVGEPLDAVPALEVLASSLNTCAWCDSRTMSIWRSTSGAPSWTAAASVARTPASQAA